MLRWAQTSKMFTGAPICVRSRFASVDACSILPKPVFVLTRSGAETGFVSLFDVLSCNLCQTQKIPAKSNQSFSCLLC